MNEKRQIDVASRKQSALLNAVMAEINDTLLCDEPVE